MWGSVGLPFQYNPTVARNLSGADGWIWDKIKLSTGDFNNDGYDDVAVVHQLADDGRTM